MVVKLSGYLAHEAQKVVILREGPRGCVLMLLWALATDNITPGQWLKAQTLYTHCDISPDAKHFVGSFIDHGHRRWRENPEKHHMNGWVAVSRPPFFSATALWYTNHFGTAAGRWTSNNELILTHAEVFHKEVKPPDPCADVRILNGNTPWSDHPFYLGRLLRTELLTRGWQEAQPLSATFVPPKANLGLDPRNRLRYFDELIALQGRQLVHPATWIYPLPSGLLRCTYSEEGTLFEAVDSSGIARMAWKREGTKHPLIAADAAGNIIYTESARLYRWTNFPEGAPSLVADLSDYTFTEVPAPDWATRW